MKIIYWDNVTDVDHAVLLPSGAIAGNSYTAQIKAEGNSDTEEAVVVDFSKGKKEFKQLLDNMVDHKLWVDPKFFVISHLSDTDVNITDLNKTWCIGLPIDCIYFYESNLDEHTTPEVFIKKSVAIVNKVLSKELSTPTINVTLIGALLPICSEPIVYFRYAHGLPKSSSYGCKNLGHGHLSYIKLIPKAESKYTHKFLSDKLYEFMQELTGGRPIYFLPKPKTFVDWDVSLHGIVFKSNDMSYHTVAKTERGNQYIDQKVKSKEEILDGYAIKLDLGHSVLFMLDQYSTIENLGEFFKLSLSKFFKENLVDLKLEDFELRISEGLSKGTIV